MTDMTRDEAVEVLRNLRDSSQRVGSESICPKWASEFAREVAALDVALAALQAQGEPVVAGWQYRRAGSDDAWTNGTEYGNHQQNTEADPEWETRLVYAFPHARPAPQQPAAGVGEEIMVNAAHDVYTLPLQPSGLSSGPRFVVHVPAPEQQPAAVDGAGGNDA